MFFVVDAIVGASVGIAIRYAFVRHGVLETLCLDRSAHTRRAVSFSFSGIPSPCQALRLAVAGRGTFLRCGGSPDPWAGSQRLRGAAVARSTRARRSLRSYTIGLPPEEVGI